MLLPRRSCLHDHCVPLRQDAAQRPVLRHLRNNQRHWIRGAGVGRGIRGALFWMLPRGGRTLCGRWFASGLGEYSLLESMGARSWELD